MTLTTQAAPTRTERAGAPAIRHVGPEPTGELLLAGSLLWSDADTARAIVDDIDVSDFEDTHLRPIFTALRSLLLAQSPHNGQAVGDELQRRGQLAGEPGRLAARRLTDAITCGAQSNGLAPRAYACAVVADSYRRRVELAGKALVEEAGGAPEHDLWPLMRERGLEVAAHAERLSRLRGGMPDVRS